LGYGCAINEVLSPLQNILTCMSTSHCNVACSKLSSLEVAFNKIFKVSHSQIFNVSSTNWGIG
jgi:hypothetical protein